MLRRCCAFLLVLACAFAPVLPVLAGLTATPAGDCCCHQQCPCEMPASTPAPCAPLRAVQSATPTVEQRVVAARPTLRLAFATFTLLLSASAENATPAVRPVSIHRPASAVSVALYEAHCSRRI